MGWMEVLTGGCSFIGRRQDEFWKDGDDGRRRMLGKVVFPGPSYFLDEEFAWRLNGSWPEVG